MCGRTFLLVVGRAVSGDHQANFNLLGFPFGLIQLSGHASPYCKACHPSDAISCRRNIARESFLNERALTPDDKMLRYPARVNVTVEG